jgi:tetratricopeptide (TPR) repeat protein
LHHAACEWPLPREKILTEKFLRPDLHLKLIFSSLLMALALRCSSQPSVAKNERDTAFALEQEGKYAQSEAAWQSVLTGHPRDAEAYAHLGLLEARQERYKESVPLYRKALALNPQIPGLRLNLGLALFKGGELKQAIEVFTPLLKSEPESSAEAQRLTALLGLADYGIGDYPAAVRYLKAAAASDPKNLQFRLLLAHSCLASREFQCVLDTYHEILTLNAESAEADMLAGEALDEMHNVGGAIEQFRAAVKADPKEPNAHFGLGYLLWTQNQFEEAAHEFQAELANVPDHPQALTFLADADMQTNHTSDAGPLIQKALKIDPRIGRAHLDLGILYVESDRKQDAIRELKEAARLMPEDANPHWRLARLYQSMGNKTQANLEFQKTRNLHKSENDTIMSKLKAAQAKGRPADDTVVEPAGNPEKQPNH